MKAKEFIAEIIPRAKEKNLIGLTINGQAITAEPTNQDWEGDFNCSKRALTSLYGSPKTVSGNFYCDHNSLASLQGAPKKVNGTFDCESNVIETLLGAPKEVGRNFNCDSNKLRSLQGAPKRVNGHFDCAYNDLITLQGAPQTVNGWFDCSYNGLKSLQGIPQIVSGNFYSCNNPIETGLIHLFRSDIKGEIITEIHPDVDELLNQVNKMNYNPNQKIAKFTAEIYKLAKRHNRPEWKDFVKP